jgi:hypothetical protein
MLYGKSDRQQIAIRRLTDDIGIQQDRAVYVVHSPLSLMVGHARDREFYESQRVAAAWSQHFHCQVNVLAMLV